MEWFVSSFRELIRFLWSLYDFMISMETTTFIRTYWAIIFLEIPRYVLTDFVVLLYSLRGRFSFDDESRQLESLDNPPSVAVILPVLNEEDTLRPTVESIREQTYPNLEVIVVDDGSDDRTPEIGRELSRKGIIEFHRQDERQGKSAALNHALEVSSSEYVIFMDSDTTLDRDAVLNMIRHFKHEDVGAVCGNLGVRNWFSNPLTMLQSIEYLISITVGRCFRSLIGILPIVSGAFGSFPRTLLERVGGHEPGPGNDSDLTIRIRKLGKRIVFDPRANCLTNAPTSVTSLIKQRLRWNRNVIRTRLFRHPDTFRLWTHHFRWQNLLSFVDTLFFTMIVTFFWAVYLIDIFLAYPGQFLVIYLANYVFHVLLKLPQVSVGLILSRRRSTHLKTLFIVPLYPAYKIALKVVRIVAVIQELFFRASFNDPFAPEKVRREMEPF